VADVRVFFPYIAACFVGGAPGTAKLFEDFAENSTNGWGIGFPISHCNMMASLPLSKEYWKLIKDAVKNHVPDALDKLPVDPKMKDIIKQIYDQLNKAGDDK
jgi:hypothetical protein